MLDVSTPSLARAWDHLLGGTANFAADRAMAAQLEGVHPEIRQVLVASRAYAADSITRIARAGVDQYLDLGAGLPTWPATHAVARMVRPDARVAYVDRDPTVAEHARSLVPAGVRYLHGDLAEPEAILASAELTGVIDLTRPACLVLNLVLHVLDQGTAHAVVGVLVRALAPGSYLIVTAGAGAHGSLPEAVRPGGFTAEDLAALLAGLDPVPPGLADGGVVGGTGYKAPRPAGPRG